MKYIIGLGNPEEKYFDTRHNIGRNIVLKFAKKNKFPDFEFDKKTQSLVSVGKFEYQKPGRKTVQKEEVTLILPETYMNNSGKFLKKVLSNNKKIESTVVIYDDLDLAIGCVKMNFNKGSGGHKGLESIIKNLKTKKFNRIRVGISAATPSGKIKKPKGEEAVIKHVLGKFSPKEQEVVKKVETKVFKSLGIFISESKEKATGFLNTG